KLDLRYVRHEKQPGADVFDLISKLAMGETIAREAVDDTERIAKVVVEAWTDDAGGQRVANITNVLAGLIPGIPNFLGAGGAFQVHKDRRDAGSREAAYEIQVRRFLQFPLKPLCDLLERLLDGRSGPGGLNHHRLDDEGGIFASSKSKIGVDTRDHGNDHDVCDERAVPKRPFRKIDHGSDPSSRIFWPGCNACT